MSHPNDTEHDESQERENTDHRTRHKVGLAALAVAFCSFAVWAVAAVTSIFESSSAHLLALSSVSTTALAFCVVFAVVALACILDKLAVAVRTGTKGVRIRLRTRHVINRAVTSRSRAAKPRTPRSRPVGAAKIEELPDSTEPQETRRK